jgi:hypothetical protein
VKQRRRDHRRLAGAHRHPLEHRSRDRQRVRIGPGGSLRGAGGAAGQQHDPSLPFRRRGRLPVGPVDQPLELVLLAVLGGGDKPTVTGLDPGGDLLKIGVVDQQLNSLSLGHLPGLPG